MYVLHKIEVAQAFDELSILEIKKSKSINQKQKDVLEKQINLLENEINQAIGFELTKKIYSSDLYLNLYNTNHSVFESVEKFKECELPRLTMQRYFAKKGLQKHFFNNDFGEVKM